ncbi:MAG TPA: type III pantothenate kinase [Fimbriimonadaceae bacterium]|nr:type III pantothenate kinase [Fimbriimonadaceae bacterium]
MLLVIDAGNTQTVYGVWDGSRWLATWRRNTDGAETEDELAVWLRGLFELANLPFQVDRVVAATVVPAIQSSIKRLSEKWMHAPVAFLETGAQVGLKVEYEPASAVGPDRLANAMGAASRYGAPAIVVDFGTATTFDAIKSDATYAGGAILPGIEVASSALVGRTSRLPRFDLKAPERAIGKTTVESLQSGLMLGYAGAIDYLAARIKQELGGVAKVVSTGGLGSVFLDLCESIETYDKTLTLDGLVIAAELLF